MKPTIQLRLFVSGRNRAALRAIKSVRAVCEDTTIRSRYRIELDVIDIHESPELADEDQVFATPTLLKKNPAPVRRVVGDLSNRQDILFTMDIKPTPGTESEAGNGKA